MLCWTGKQAERPRARRRRAARARPRRHAVVPVVRARRGRPVSSGRCAAPIRSCTWRRWPLGKATRHFSIGRTAELPCAIGGQPPHVAALPVLYSGHAVTVPHLGAQEAPNRLVLAIKAFPPFSHVSTQAAAVRHRCRPGELPASCVHDAVRVRLALLHTPIEPACARVVLAEPSARRSPSSRGRRRITIAELAPPPVLQTRGPI
jgi:hypothetical protein